MTARAMQIPGQRSRASGFGRQCDTAACVRLKPNARQRHRKGHELQILVCVKQVPDTEAKVVVAEDGRSISERDITFIMNPYDEYAVEAAVRIKEASPSEVTVALVTVGPPRADDSLRLGLAMGADSATRVWDEALENVDGGAVAAVLGVVAQRVGFDLVLCGRIAIDDAMGEVPLRLASRLGLPHANAVTELTVADGSARARCEIEGGTQVVELGLPALITTQKGLNEPRYPAIPAIMKARRMPIEPLSLESLGMDPEGVRAATLTQVDGLTVPPGRGAGRVIAADSPEEAARELARLLRDEAKVL
jgi:electron transfer flavoprotein beta subunit